jgi:heterodisulfide reductase subunit A
MCAKVCPYHAIEVDSEKKVAKVIEAACAGCGTCGAECPYDAITMRHFTDEQIGSQIDAATEDEAEKKIVAFCCNWCSYAGADFAGVSRMQYPTLVRSIRTMCSGRIAPKFVYKAFANGASAVLVSGCHLSDCHYINANEHTLKRVEKLWKNMERNNINKERLQLAWISASEGEKFAKTVKHMEEIISNVSKEDIEKSQNWAKDELEKLEKRKKKMLDKKKKEKKENDKGIEEEEESKDEEA